MRRIERARTNEDRQKFAAWLRTRLVELGYDLSTPRAGGQAEFARHAGISHPVVSRTLRGTNSPSPDVLEAMAPVLKVPLRELLVQAGILTEGELPGGAGAAGEGQVTPERLAAMAGIHEAGLVQQFVTFVAGLRAQQAQKELEQGNNA
ncbi:helix-turn-helix transcriptional regulator [Streptomyces sp. NBC_01456]|uniref:helix-turn-helix domain-containing protein n=1 Tax=Streptomyces sp. NBC_01456 TaxID=2975868 RepID=UPI002E31BE17|nr:helix-turn-helix transcriptional regulator [Streptomyces sp. NBC_01456]